MDHLKIVILFVGTVAFAVLAVTPYPAYTVVPDYGRPLFVVCSLLCLACGLWIVRRVRTNRDKATRE